VGEDREALIKVTRQETEEDKAAKDKVRWRVGGRALLSARQPAPAQLRRHTLLQGAAHTAPRPSAAKP
jgi:hypothetical protein